MTTIAQIFNTVKAFSRSDKEILISMLVNSLSTLGKDTHNFIEAHKKPVCPACNSVAFVRNGRRKDGSQRYVCKDCKKSYSITTNTILASTKKEISVWNKYIECMMNEFSVRKSAEICDISVKTAFLWRHKVLDALQNMANTVTVNGIVEADETYFPISYKGNHKKSGFVMPRCARHRGMEVHTRGVSKEQVCVPCAVTRDGLSIAKVAKAGNVSINAIKAIFNGRMAKGTTLITDKCVSYKQFAKANNLELVQIKAGHRHKYGIFHIQHINSYHSELKRFIRDFKGVSTKYLNNYLIWHNFAHYAKESYKEKLSILAEFTFSTTKTVLRDTFSKREALPLVA